VGLPLAVLGIREEEGPLDDQLARLDGDLLLLALRQEGGPLGLGALDGEGRAAAIEAQALGRVSPTPPEPREATAADAALARPLFESFLREAQAAVESTPLAGWLRDPSVAERLPSAREAAMLLPDGRYRMVRMTLDLGAGGRQGLFLLLARLPEPPRQLGPPGEEPEATVATQALRSQARVEAVLHRLRLPLSAAEALEPGQLLPLPGVTVASVRLEAGGVPLGPARLGQVAGMRAVRIETPLAPELADLAGLGAPPAPLLPEPAWPLPPDGEVPGWSLPQSEEAPDWGPPETVPMG
jgi:flagellar motor switch protein FliM